MNESGKFTEEIEKMKNQLEYWKKRSSENEEKNRNIAQNIKVLEEIKEKSSTLEQENLTLMKSIEELSREALLLNENKNDLITTYNDANAKYNKLKDNYAIYVSELEKIEELNNQYNNPDFIVQFISYWNNIANLQILIFKLEDYLLSKLKKREEINNFIK